MLIAGILTARKMALMPTKHHTISCKKAARRQAISFPPMMILGGMAERRISLILLTFSRPLILNMELAN